MAFVSYPSPTRPSSTTSNTLCAAKHPSTPRKHSPTKDTLVGHSNASRYLSSLQRDCDTELVGQTFRTHPLQSSAQKASKSDIWDTLIDDHTKVEDIIQPTHQTSSSQVSTVDCAQARMAARPSHTPKPEFNMQTEQNTIAKKNRGRPKGSKSKKTSPIPPPKISPFMSAVREDLRRRSMTANRDLVSGILDTQSEEPNNWDQVNIIAPNGLPDDDGANKDLLQELLPILSQQENEKTRIITEEERRIKRLIATCYTQVSSIHRSSDRLDNLKPYKLKKESEEDCDACNGTGMTVCEYCDGQGYVDLGENGEEFRPKFRNNEFTMPKHVMGNIYHCPLCGGLQQERCESCFGTGTAAGGKEVAAGASTEPKDNRAWKLFDMDELIRREADRIEIGLDGLVIMRAKPRGRRKETKVDDEDNKSSVRRRRRGRPPKNHAKGVTTAKHWDEDAEPENVVQDEADLTPDLQIETDEPSIPLTEDGDQSLITTPGTVVIPRGRPVVRTTDFVNTTDYQVGRRLQRQSPTTGQSFADAANLNFPEPREKKDRVEKIDDVMHE